MIGRLRGELREKRPVGCVVECGGVGYELRIPLSTWHALGMVGEVVELRVYTHVREDRLELYGFATERERAAFELLIAVNGVGCGVAVKVLSGVQVEELVRAVQGQAPELLYHVPGVGAGKAQQICLALKEKVWALDAGGKAEERDAGARLRRDVIGALENLGYTRGTAVAALEESEVAAQTDFEAMFSAALRRLTRKK